MTHSAESNTTRAHVLISGRVQGVNFRWNTQREAQRLGLTGWVRNTWDGRVEAVFEGEDSAVHQAVAWCRHGQPPAWVENVEVTYGQATGEFSGFNIRG